jgi:hypothetical protein
VGGEIARGAGRPVLVAGDDVGVLQVRGQDLGLGGLARLSRLNLDDLDRPQAQGPAGGGGAFGIVAGQLRLGGAAQPADAQQRNLQLAVARVGGSTDQIFSML